jgi:hypothetical protein
MKWQWSLLSLALLGTAAQAQEAAPKTTTPAEGMPVSSGTSCMTAEGCSPTLFPADCERPSGFLYGNHEFDNFIGWMSNLFQNIDPRSVTEIAPVFGNGWVSSSGPLLAGNMQVYGAALNLALSERLCVGLNQGGYAAADFNGKGNGLFRDRFGLLHNRLDFAGQREGWLNLGGFAQYTLIEDVPDQFLLTAGMRIEVPTGSQAMFQGNGPVHLAPYATIGKEFGDFHVLATAGYLFPTASGTATTNLFYGNIHFDRQFFGWLYPLIEFNWNYHTTSVAPDLPIRRGFIDFDNFESTGNIVTLAAGADAVLVKGRVEFGAVYSTPIATQRDFNANGLLVKLVLRY